MRTIVGVAVMAILVSIVAVSTLAVTDEVEFGSESGGSEINTTVCVPVVAHACQSSAVQ